MLPSFIYPTISSTKLTIFAVRHTGRRKRAGHRNQWSDMRSRFLSITLAAHGYSVSDNFYGLQHFWYNVMITCFARFSPFRYFWDFCYYFLKSKRRESGKTCYHYIIPEVLQPIKFAFVRNVPSAVTVVASWTCQSGWRRQALYLWLPSMDDSIRPAICVIRAWRKRPGIGWNASCALGDCSTSRPWRLFAAKGVVVRWYSRV